MPDVFALLYIGNENLISKILFKSFNIPGLYELTY